MLGHGYVYGYGHDRLTCTILYNIKEYIDLQHIMRRCRSNAIEWNTHRSYVYKIRMVHTRDRFSTAHSIKSYGSGFRVSQLYLILHY